MEKISVIGLHLEGGQIALGDTIAYEFPIDFIEEQVSSLQVENESVEKAETGVLAGMVTTLTKEQAKIGTRVFRVRKK